ncbi:LINE-1 retrotransposable element ORF2 protein [Cucumis melo var. makuwa]|uniref:LINE-1 retrotransposable element ORF2 protein n=1 Tax=Cucumis melo var. makuwa TaxID=1194695 RepID=A0A5A7UZW8_CUCMM|nr:LINE-1 retrotransposable element ORF2 protein [Cucumis melo var. makuwa]TYK21612.1 LINE-1 retrotransposable element ORF2 protein [Cucumis melo var. makuwa]
MDSLESQNSLTMVDIDIRKALKLDLFNATIKEAQYWVQRAKRLWINEGDENTNFFHKVCSARRRRNQISSIYDKDDINHISNEDIQKAFVAHFNNIYSSKNKISCLIDNLEWNPIDNISSDSLISPFAEEEIQNSIFSFEDNKALGPEGFTLDFF